MYSRGERLWVEAVVLVDGVPLDELGELRLVHDQKALAHVAPPPLDHATGLAGALRRNGRGRRQDHLKRRRLVEPRSSSNKVVVEVGPRLSGNELLPSLSAGRH